MPDPQVLRRTARLDARASWPLAGRAGLRFALCAVCLVASVAPSWAAEAGATPLKRRLAGALAVRGLAGAELGVLVVRRGDGEVVFARNPDQALMPASNQKLLTIIGALSALGPSYRFRTPVLADAPLATDGAVGRLYVRGAGDPALTSEQWWRVAADLRLAGLRSVADGIVVDDRLFDDEHWNPNWGDVSARAYHAPVGALMANYGSFRVRVAPTGPGRSARVSLDPDIDYFSLEAKVATVPGAQATVRVERGTQGEQERIVVTGSIGASAEPVEAWRSVARPAHYAAAVLRMQLEANGIHVAGPIRAGVIPDDATVLLEHEGRSLGEIARLCLKYSSNPIAESLFKYLAVVDPTSDGVGRWPAGAAALRRALVDAGLDPNGARFVDGSGLSREDRVPARLLVGALSLADRSFRFGPDVVSALPIAGADGTLENRAKASVGRVRAKTGLLTGVTGLSGYALAGDGKGYVFSLLANGYQHGDAAAMDAVDGFVAELVR